jgi:hypothetical protein
MDLRFRISRNCGLNMKLRAQHEGRPMRILFVFDPRRVGYLILGGDKTGNAD